MEALASSSTPLTAEVVQACSVDYDPVLEGVIVELGKSIEELETEVNFRPRLGRKRGRQEKWRSCRGGEAGAGGGRSVEGHHSGGRRGLPEGSIDPFLVPLFFL